MGSLPEKRETTGLVPASVGTYGSYQDDPSRTSKVKDEEEATDPSCVARMYPTGFWRELGALIKMSAPLIAQQMTMYMMGPVALIFCGHLGKVELDAVALACSFLNVFGISLAVGLASACDTLFSQVYGSENKHKLGIVLQRSLLIIGLGALPCLAIHINAEAICRLLGQDPEVSRLAGEYMLVLIPGTISFFFFISILKYIQNQNVIIPTLIMGAIVNVANIILHYVLIYVVDMGIMGSALAQSVCYFLYLLLSVGYVFISGIYKKTWNGWDAECLQHWGQFLYLAITGTLMICIEWWTFEAGIFLAGNLGTAELGAQSLVMQVEIICYMFPLGNGIAASIRVGQYLGNGEPKAACTAARVAITFITAMGLFIGVLLFSLKDYLPLVFTNEPDVIAVASTLFPIMGVYMVFDSVAGTCSGILRGSGNQGVGAWIVFSGYFIALSIGVPLMFLTPLGVIGFWIGLSVALFLDSIIFFTFVVRTDWEKQARLARERVGVIRRSISEEEADEERRGSGTEMTSPLLSSSNIHNHVPIDESRDMGEEPISDKLPLKTVLIRRTLGAAAMLGVLVLGVVLRTAVIEIDYPDLVLPVTSNTTTDVVRSTVTAMTDFTSVF